MVADQFDYVVIDGEAGIEQINRRVMEKVTHLLLVTDTSKKGVEVIKTIARVASGMVSYDELGVIVNRVEDMSRVDKLDLADLKLLAAIASDPILAEYDFEGRSLLELPGDSAAVRGTERALENLGG